MPTFQIPDVLSRYSDGLHEVSVEGATVADVLQSLFERFPGLAPRVLDANGRLWPYLLLFVDGAEVVRGTLAETGVPEDGVVELVGMAEGGAGDRDVRMRGFRSRVSVDVAREAALAGLDRLPAESVPVTDSAGRVLAEDVVSGVDVPGFDRSAMDGYAVRAADTFGASAYDPVPLTLVGESMPGRDPTVEVGAAQACRIMTGAPLPPGADAVVKAEDTDVEGEQVFVRAPSPAGRHVGRVGEDVACGSVVLVAGRRLRPQDAGLLAAIGAHPVAVVRRPRVRIVVSGNELLPPGSPPRRHHIVDSNSPMLAALIESDGGDLESVRRVADDPAVIRDALSDGGADVLLVSGGSSVGREDHLPGLVRELGELPVHGVAMRPSSPAGVGSIGAARVFLLPGNPVSCLTAYEFFAGPAIRTLAGLSPEWPHPTTEAELADRIVSVVGRTDYARVELRGDQAHPLGVSGASILSSTTRADGFVIVPESSEGLAPGTRVVVRLYEGRAARMRVQDER